jgi:acetyl esterase
MKCVLLLAAVTATLASGRALENIEYAQVSGQALRLDAYIPDGPGPHPAAIIVHGGAWVTGDKARSVRPLFKPLADAGIAWFSIEYRLARGNNPESLISIEGLAALASASDDVRNATAYVRSHANEWSINPEKIILIGESAGAHLASMAALKPAPGQPPQAVVAFYSPSDLEKLAKTSPRIPDSLRNLLKGSPLEAILLNGLRQLSPQTWISKSAPPFLMIHGTADMTVPFEQSEAMCAALRDAGANCELFPVAGAGHGFNYWETQPSMTAYKAKMISWIQSTLAGLQ